MLHELVGYIIMLIQSNSKLSPAILYKYDLMIFHQKSFAQLVHIAQLERVYNYFKKKTKKMNIKAKIRLRNKLRNKLKKFHLSAVSAPILTMWDSFKIQSPSKAESALKLYAKYPTRM